jgi:hypothetical protein
MANPKLIDVIETECQPADAEKFNKWYNEVHIPMLLKSKGVTGVARYQVAVEPGKPPRFIAIYQFPGEKALESFQKDPQTGVAIKDFNDNWGSKVKMVSHTTGSLIKDW